MRRILFPALGVVVLLLAYAGQELAAGAPSAPRTSAQAPVRLLEMGDEAKVLKHIALAEEQLLAGLAHADRRQGRLIKKVERQEAVIEQEADKILTDEHKAEQIMADEDKARTAQAPTTAEQQLIATLADLQVQIQALQRKGTALTQEESAELKALVTKYQAYNNELQQLIEAQQNMVALMNLVSATP